MIFYSKMLKAVRDNKPHNFVFVAKGNDYRKGGYKAIMNNSIVSSSFHSASTFNLTSLSSGQVRKIYSMLILKFDGKKVVY